MFQRTLACFRRAQVLIPQLSPTHTKAKIVQWCIEPTSSTPVMLESYDPLFVLQCSPDLITEGFREYDDHEPQMIVEAHDEGVLTIDPNIKLNEWYDVGTPVGFIDDGDDDPDDDGEWVWQAYTH